MLAARVGFASSCPLSFSPDFQFLFLPPRVGDRIFAISSLTIKRLFEVLNLIQGSRALPCASEARHVGELFLNADFPRDSTSRRMAYEVIFSPMMPERMRPIQASLSNVAGSLKR